MKKSIYLLTAALLIVFIPISQADTGKNLNKNLTAITTTNNFNELTKSPNSIPLTRQNKDANRNDDILLDIPANDECTNAIIIIGPYPATVSGTTLEATVDCPDGFNGEAVWYKISAPFPENEIIIDYCLTENDQIGYTAEILYSECPYDAGSCDDYITAYQAYDKNCDNGYRNAYRRWISIPGPAEYYLPVYFDIQSDFSFDLTIFEYTPVVIDCPGEADPELETCGANTNGGCTMDEGSEAFEPINCGVTVCGTYWSDYYLRDTDWYELSLPERGFVKWSAFGEAPTRIWIYDGTGGCDGIYLGSIGVDPGDTASLELELFPGTYWLVVGIDGWYDVPCDGSGMFTNDYVASIECELGTPALSVTPLSVYGEAVESFSDSEILTVSNAGTGRLVFTADATQDIFVTLLNNEAIDINHLNANGSSITLGDLLSPDAPENLDEYYSSLPQLLDLANEKPVTNDLILVDCPPDAVQEAENCGDDINGGCAMTPGSESFEAFSCNSTVCGTVWSNGTIRDTDWYIVELTEPKLFSFSVTADFPFLIFLLQPGPEGNECDDFEALSFAVGAAGDTASITSSLPAGTYWLWVGPSAWYNMPCDGSGDFSNDYVASVICESPWFTIDVVSGVIHEGEPDIEITVLMDASELDAGTYTGNIKFNSNDETNSPLNVPVTFIVNEAYSYLPGDVNMGVAPWPPEVTGADITYLTAFFRGQTGSCDFDGFWASADLNGDCLVIGSDLTYIYSYLRGLQEEPTFCPDFPHINPTEENYPACTLIPVNPE